MERIRESNERIKLSHQKRMDSTKLAFSNLSAKLKTSKPKQNPTLARQWSEKRSHSFDSTRFSTFASKFKATSFTPLMQRKQKALSEKFYTLDLDISNSVKLRMYDEKRRLLFSAELGQAVPPNTNFSVRREPDKYTVEYFGYGVLTISYLQLGESDFYEVLWVLDDNVQMPLQDTISLQPSQWFGGSVSARQTWPSSGRHKLFPYVPWDTENDPRNGFGSVLERYWLSAAGVGVYVDSDVPLYVSEDYDDKKELTLIAMYDRPYKNLFDHRLFLTYAILQSPDMKITHDIISEELFFKSKGRPNPDLFRLPIFSIKPSSRPDLTLLDHVNKLTDHTLGPCVIELEDDWTPNYGDFVFSPKRFPNIKNMIATAKDRGFRIMLWVHPFASPMSKAFYEGENIWVRSAVVEGVTGWKHGPAKLLDVTSPEAWTWLRNNLYNLQEEFGVDGFTFDFGQVNYLPPLRNTFEPLSNPNSYTRNYLDLAHDITAPYCFGVVRSGVGTHNVPLMTCMAEKKPSWGWDNGLKTVIPSVLTLGLMGYRYILPGMVGGNTSKGKPSAELYIRWLETVLLMPAVKFSLPPWEYGEETLGLVHKLLALRDSFLEYLERVAVESEVTGAPMVRPLWWRAPRDTITHTIDSQFMLGGELIVAPVQEKGIQHRAIYLPSGTWKDGLRGNTLQGGCWLYSYRARLGQLPHFTLVQEAENNVQ